MDEEVSKKFEDHDSRIRQLENNALIEGAVYREKMDQILARLNNMPTTEEFNIIKKIVFGGVGIVLASVFVLILNLAIGKV